MSGKRKSLGRGLDALLGASELREVLVDSPKVYDGNVVPSQPMPGGMGAFAYLPIEFLSKGRYQPRREFDPEALDELAESIKKQGLLQPVVVRHTGEESYEIIAGERRWRACLLAGLPEIPVIVKAVDDETALALALIENIQREDLNAMEEAQALVRLQEEFQLSQQQVADAVGKSRTAVANLMRLIRLAPEVQTLLSRGDIDMGHARALLALETHLQAETARRVVDSSLNVRQSEKMVRSLLKPPVPNKKPKLLDPDIARLEEDLSQRLGAPVRIQHAGKGGKLVVRYSSVDELDGILAHIK